MARTIELYGEDDDEENVVVPKPKAISLMDPNNPYDAICSNIRKFSLDLGLTIKSTGDGGCDGLDTMLYGDSEICKFDWNEMKKSPIPSKKDLEIVKRNMKQSKSEVEEHIMAMVKLQQL
jgi:hypothetical protein